jgi:cytochrome P450 family 130
VRSVGRVEKREPRPYKGVATEERDLGFVYDPEDEGTQVDPYPFYQRLRDDHPVYRQERLGFWALSRFAGVHDALRDHESFCSSQGLTWDPSAAEAAGVLPMMVTADPPQHSKLRKLVNRGFTPRRVTDLAPEIRAVVVEAIEALRRSGSGDLVHDLAVPLPTAIIGRFLGVPQRDRGRFHEWATAVVRGTSGAAFHEEHHRGAAELYAYFQQVIGMRRASTADDLIGSLLASEIDGERLTDADVLGFCFNLIVGGIETTTNLIAAGMVILQEHPADCRLLAERRERIPAALEEFLRLETPVQGLCRTTTRPVTAHDTTIPPGEKVLLLFGSANRDEREFTAPERFDLERNAERHVAFGYGAHYCIGAALARLMGRVAFEELTTRLGDHRIDVDGGRRIRSAVNRGWQSLPIEVGGIS